MTGLADRLRERLAQDVEHEERALRYALHGARNVVDSVLHTLTYGGAVSETGELQGAGPAFDVACARLAKARRAQKALEPLIALIAQEEAALARLREGLDELALHDDTGDPSDEGYAKALADVRELLDGAS